MTYEKLCIKCSTFKTITNSTLDTYGIYIVKEKIENGKCT